MASMSPPPVGKESPQAGPVRPKPARQRIFDAARELFYQQGIRAVGVDAIALQASATKMSLYRAFPGKDELLVA